MTAVHPVAIVTGAGRGIGRATAIALAQRGYRLVLTARTLSDLEETARLAGGEGVSVAGDITELAHTDSLVQRAIERFGRIDALINNAGYAPVLNIEQVTADEWRRIIDTNLTATVTLIRTVWPVMKQQGSGVIVNISSVAARDPFPGLGVYGAAKAGVNLLGLALAREGEDHGIRVHTIAPSATETEMFRGIFSKEQMPTEKILQPTDVANVIVACVVGDLRYTSGEVITVRKTA